MQSKKLGHTYAVFAYLSKLLFILFLYSRYIFDRVFNTNEDNSKVYQDLGFDIIEAAVSGFNSTIFAYGQTASGKTHTMMGDDQQKGKYFFYKFCNRLYSFLLRQFLSQFAIQKFRQIRVSVQGVESLWGDCRFIPADWGSQWQIVLFCSF